MAASSTSFQPGVQSWKQRSKNGRDAIFQSPEVMLESAVEYFSYVDANPYQRPEFIKSGDRAGEIIYIPIQKPYTLWGLCIFLGVNSGYFHNFRTSITYNDNKESWDKVLTFISDVIKERKYEGAAVGAYNANIIMRDLGLTEIQKQVEASDSQNLPPSQTFIYLPQKGSTEIEDV